ERMFVRWDYIGVTANFIKGFYGSIGINDPDELSIDCIVNNLCLKLFYWPHSSAIATQNNRYVVFINDSINEQQQWQEFGHEVYHYFYDETNYNILNESYATYGESKADYFAYHFCVPTFMLQRLKGVDVYDVMYLFNVEFDFALRRLEMYKSRCLLRGGIYEKP